MRFRFVSAICLALAGLAIPAWSFAQESKKAKEKPKPAAAEEEDSLAELEKMFVVPESTKVDDYARFLDRIMKFRPNTDEEAQMLRRKAPLALKKASEKIVKLEKNTKSDVYRRANGILVIAEANELLAKLAQTEEGVPDEKLKGLIDKVAKHLALGEPGEEEAQMALSLGSAFEQLNKPDLARQSFEAFAKPISAAKDPAVAKTGARLAGMAHRMGLEGKQVELTGKTIDGKDFDIATLKGKVVLIDFWATWCGPCRRSIPHLIELHEKYKDQGLEVVGVSLDQKGPSVVIPFVAQNKISYSVLMGNQKMVQDFGGVRGIPTAFIISQDGKIYSKIIGLAPKEKYEESIKALLGLS
jgi:thiol-disulfide isomerase/thioredoxin